MNLFDADRSHPDADSLPQKEASMATTTKNRKRRYLAAAALTVPLFTMGLVKATFSEAAATVPLTVSCNSNLNVDFNYYSGGVTGALIGNVGCVPTNPGHIDIPTGSNITATVHSASGYADSVPWGGTFPADKSACTLAVTSSPGNSAASLTCT